MSELRFDAPDAATSVDVPEGIIDSETGEAMLLTDVEVVGTDTSFKDSEVQRQGMYRGSGDELPFVGGALVAGIVLLAIFESRRK